MNQSCPVSYILSPDAIRMQSDLAEKLEKRRETRMKKLADKHAKERATYQDKAEGGSKAENFIKLEFSFLFLSIHFCS